MSDPKHAYSNDSFQFERTHERYRPDGSVKRWTTVETMCDVCDFAISDDCARSGCPHRDPTPWCHICGAMTKAKCGCGPRAENDQMDWVRCDERMPDTDGWYLVTIKFSSGPVVRSDKLMTMHGCKAWLQYMTNQVTAWQPLPEAFK